MVPQQAKDPKPAAASPESPCKNATPISLIEATLTEGEKSIDGCADLSGFASIQVQVVPVGATLDCSKPSSYTQNRTGNTLGKVAGAKAVEFFARLANPLTNGETVCVGELETNGKFKSFASLSVQALPALALNPCTGAKALPTILGTLVDGQALASGCADNKSTEVEIAVIGADSATKCSEQDPAKFAQKPVSYVTAQSPTEGIAQFVAQFSPALKSGQQVCVTEKGEKGTKPSAPLPVQALPAASQNACAAEKTLPTILGTLVDGQVLAPGCADDKSTEVEVAVIGADSATKCSEPDPAKFAQKPTSYVPAQSPTEGIAQFAAQFSPALKNGQQVCVTEKDAKGTKTSPPLAVKAVPAPSQNACAAEKTLPTILGPLVSGQTVVSGCADDKSPEVKISVIGAGSPTQCNAKDTDNLPQKTTSYATAQGASEGVAQFTAQIPTALKTGEQVCLAEVRANGQEPKLMAGSALVKSAPSEDKSNSCDTATEPSIPQPLVAGLKVISGCAGSKEPGSIIVAVYSPGAGAGAKNAGKGKPNGGGGGNVGGGEANGPPAGNAGAGGASAAAGNTPPPETETVCPDAIPNPNPLLKIPVPVYSNGVFSAELVKPLKAKDYVCVWQVSGGKILNQLKSPISVPKWGYAQSDTERGRLRYYFSGGIAFSQDNQQFSNQDLYAGFDLERNWVRGWSHAFLTSDFSAQLTSIPTAATVSGPPGATGATGSSGPTTSPVSSFISSRKAAVIGGDVYFPMYANAFKWWYDGGSTMFLAPLFKGGLQTITEGALSVTSPAPGTSTTTTTLNNAGLYYYWGGGIRLGDMKLFDSWNNAPQVLSHLDITFGKWQNFKQCGKANVACTATGSTVYGLYEPLVVALDGRLDIPKTPIQIGFSSVTPLNGGGQGDLRFFFGVKLNVGCLYKGVKNGKSLQFLECADDQTAANEANAKDVASPNDKKPAPKPEKPAPEPKKAADDQDTKKTP